MTTPERPEPAPSKWRCMSGDKYAKCASEIRYAEYGQWRREGERPEKKIKRIKKK